MCKCKCVFESLTCCVTAALQTGSAERAGSWWRGSELDQSAPRTADPEASETAGDERWPYHTQCSSLPSVCTTQSDKRERETAVSEALQSQRQTSRPQFLQRRVLHTKIWQFNLIDRFYATISHVYDVKIFFSKEKKVTKVYLEELAETVFPVN